MCVCFVSLSECYGSSNGVKTERPEHGGLLNICCELSSLCFIVLQGGPSRLFEEYQTQRLPSNYLYISFDGRLYAFPIFA